MSHKNIFQSVNLDAFKPFKALMTEIDLHILLKIKRMLTANNLYLHYKYGGTFIALIISSFLELHKKLCTLKNIEEMRRKIQCHYLSLIFIEIFFPRQIVETVDSLPAWLLPALWYRKNYRWVTALMLMLV